MLVPPGWDYWLGTDQFGRDILTRLVYVARTALFVGLVSAFLGATTGLVLGVASVCFGGTFYLLSMRFIDVFMAFPVIIMALAIVSIFGSDLHFVILAITLPIIPDCARNVRSNALQIRAIPYVDAARALGFTQVRIILRHMLPNVMAPVLIIMTSAIGGAILLEASLSFLGMGGQEPTPAWASVFRRQSLTNMAGSSISCPPKGRAPSFILISLPYLSSRMNRATSRPVERGAGAWRRCVGSVEPIPPRR